MVEQGLKYLETHEWVKDEGDGLVMIGISGVALDLLGDIVYLELPEVGSSSVKGESFGIIESVKAASDIYSPVSGEIVGVNKIIEEDFNILKDSPYRDGWMIQIKMSDASDLDGLLDAEGYKSLVEKQ